MPCATEYKYNNGYHALTEQQVSEKEREMETKTIIMHDRPHVSNDAIIIVIDGVKDDPA